MEQPRFDLSDATAVDKALEAAWYERGFLTDQEAVGADGSGGGLLSGSASVGVLRILQERRWIKAWVGRLAPRGKRRLWPLSHVLRAQLAIDVADGLDVSFVTSVALLRTIGKPIADETTEVPSTLHDLITEFVKELESERDKARAETKHTQLGLTVSATLDSSAQPDRDRDTRVHLVDRKLVVFANAKRSTGLQTELTAVARSLKSTAPEFDPITSVFGEEEVLNRLGPLVVEPTDVGAALLAQSLSLGSVNLSESLRRFANRAKARR